MINKAIFLDRDGVLNALVYRPKTHVWDSPYTLEEFNLLPRVAQAVKLVKYLGFFTVVVSNQPGVAKGKCKLEFLSVLNDKLQQELSLEDTSIDAIYYCLHHPDSILDSYKTNCHCRKPNPGLIVQAAKDHNINIRASYLVGDRPVDITAGNSAGCKTIQVENAFHKESQRSPNARPIWTVPNLLSAVKQIEKEENQNGNIPGHS